MLRKEKKMGDGRKKHKLFSRREFLVTTGSAAMAMSTLGFPAIVRAGSKIDRIIVLAVDGMDPGLLHKYMAQGRMPNAKRLVEMGSFKPLGTSYPPQSPVAWSNFIAGTNPGGHGIFDFIARDSETLLPYLATARTTPPKHTLELGKFNIPLSSPKTELLRHGPTLWAQLQEAGLDATVVRAPVNFPPTDSDAKTLSGLTTPDIHGSYGVFSFFTNSPEWMSKDVPGGRVSRVILRDGLAQCTLRGPGNSFKIDNEKINIDFTAAVDPDRPLARIRIQDADLFLRGGEWSDWVTLKFPMIPYFAETSGICRFYLKQAHPYFQLYVTPVNIDPGDPAMPISTPSDYAEKLTRELGKFYTQGMPEDTSALSSGVFSDDDYRQQATFCLEENMRMYENEFAKFDKGFFYCYFSCLDLNSHAFWRTIDPQHPLYTPELAARHGDFLPWLYSRMDDAIGTALKGADDRTLVLACSDHGFCSFRRQFNLNSWLMDNGFAHARNPRDRGYSSFFQDTDWGQTKAYGLGINSLYLNIRGREPDGVVNPGDEAESLRTKLIEQLTAVRDPKTGDQVITSVFRPEEIFSGPYVKDAPDLIVGYNENYRASWDTILGSYPKEVLLDNTDPWSGDHCMDPQFLPGVLLSNRPIALETPTLSDLAPSILSAVSLPVPKESTGKNVLA